MCQRTNIYQHFVAKLIFQITTLSVRHVTRVLSYFLFIIFMSHAPLLNQYPYCLRILSYFSDNAIRLELFLYAYERFGFIPEMACFNLV